MELQVAERMRSRAQGNRCSTDAMTVYERNLLLRALEKHGWKSRRRPATWGCPLSTMKFQIDKFGVARPRASACDTVRPVRHAHDRSPHVQSVYAQRAQPHVTVA